MAVTKTNSNRIVLSNAAYLHVTPWTDEDTIGAETIDIVNIVGDTLSFTPDDNTINAKESEFSDAPLYENISLGKIQFAATCIDFQNVIMKGLFGWKEVGDQHSMVAPTTYKDIFVTIEVGFKNEDTVVVVPKIKLNSKAIISTMKTGTSEGNLSGTAYEEGLTIASNPEASTTMAFLNGTDAKSGSGTYKIKSKTFTVEQGVVA